MREFLLYICALAIVQVLITSCNDAMNSDSNIVKKVSDDGNVPLGDILPLSIGNYWNYHEQDWQGYGNVDGKARLDDTVKLEIKRDTLIGSNKWFFIEKTDSIRYMESELNDRGYVLYSNRSDNLFFNNDLYLYNIYSSSEILFWKYPAQVNELSGGFTVKSRDTLIYVPSGSFHCYFFQIKLEQHTNFYRLINFYLCPKIGIIKSEFFWINNDQITDKEILELISYKVN